MIRIGGVYATFCKEEGILLQKHGDRNGSWFSKVSGKEGRDSINPIGAGWIQPAAYWAVFRHSEEFCGTFGVLQDGSAEGFA